MGSGITLIEAIINGRQAYGTDINPVSVLISRAKTTPIEPLFLQQQAFSLLAKIKSQMMRGCPDTYSFSDMLMSIIGVQNN
jgi:hypothetical protein